MFNFKILRKVNVVIDQGNTAVKYFLFYKDNIINSKVGNLNENYDNFTFFIAENGLNPAETRIIYSSTSGYNSKILENKVKKFKNLIIFNHETKIPIKNLYKTPKTLGYDRLAGIIGANYLFPNQNILCIDMGTAITYDYVNSENQYIGGNISPGIEMRYKALNHFTEKLPLLSKSGMNKKIGQNTSEAITLGVENGVLNEIEGYITDFEQTYENNKIILTGGDCFFFEKRLKNYIFANPNLVPIGLNRILNYNDRNN